MTSQTTRAAFCAAIAHINQPHILLLTEQTGGDAEPFHKLLRKVLSFLRGELKSEANLLRFHDAFFDWRDQLKDDDSINDHIVQLACSALHGSIEALFDAECNDLDLLLAAVNEIYAEIEVAGNDSQSLSDYWTELQQEFNEIVGDQSQRPLPKAYFNWLQETDVSLFGLTH